MRILDLNWTRTEPSSDGSAPPTVVVGWPTSTDVLPQPRMYALAAKAIPEYKAAGFTHLLLPPPCLAAAGRFSDGYDLKDNYTLDGTAWGDAVELIAFVRQAHENGLQVGLDLTLHQYDGYPNQEYTTAKFPKDPTCFAIDPTKPPRAGNVQPDSVPDPSGNWPDGDLAAYDQPNRYMWNNTIDWATWIITSVPFDFIRVDEAKGLHAPFVHTLLTSPFIDHLWVMAEYFDGNPVALGGYVWYWQKGRVSVLDFGFKFNVGNICNNNTRAWMGALSNIGYVLQDNTHAVTFIDSHDTDNSPGEQTIWNKLLGYAIMFTFPGATMTYYRDWSTDAYCYGLKERINNYLWIHQHLAQGDFVVRYDNDPQVFAHERLGYGSAPGCVCFFNNDRWHEHTVTVQTRYPGNTRLHEYTGNNGYNADKWTDSAGRLTVTIPRNNNGLSSLVYGLYIS